MYLLVPLKGDLFSVKMYLLVIQPVNENYVSRRNSFGTISNNAIFYFLCNPSVFILCSSEQEIICLLSWVGRRLNRLDKRSVRM